MPFSDRRDAGRQLAELLVQSDPDNPLVLALPRGGVPVGYEIAEALDCPLDVALVRKVGVPGQPELAMGAVAEGATVVKNPEIQDLAGVTDDRFDDVVRREMVELERRALVYRQVAGPINPTGTTAIVVDDGIATGSTAMAAVEALAQRGALEVWLAVPVAPRETAALIESEVDRLFVVELPTRFGAVGMWYRDFGQTTDDEVRELLAASRLR